MGADEVRNIRKALVVGSVRRVKLHAALAQLVLLCVIGWILEHDDLDMWKSSSIGMNGSHCLRGGM